MDLSYRSGYRH